MKRVLIISALFPPEPVVSANLSFDIASEVSKKNNVTVISPYPSRPNGKVFNSQNKSNFSFEHLYVNSYISNKSNIYSRFRESLSFGLKSLKFIRENHYQYDSIYMNSWPLIAQFLTVFEAKRYRLPIVTHVHDLYPESLIQKIPYFKNILYYLLLPIDKYILNNSSYVITISKSMRELLIKSRNLCSSKVYVAYNWQDETLFNKINHNSIDIEEKFKFMYAGSISNLAVIEDLILAFNEAKINNSELIIAGDGSDKKRLMTLVSKMNFKNIKFIKFNQKNIGLTQSNSDVLILSLKKGASKFAFPPKIPAYMFSSKPILTYVDKNSEISETIKRASCGWSVDSSQIYDLSLKMIEISNISKETLKELGRNGYEFALNNLSKKTNLELILNKIESSLKKSNVL